MRTAVKCPIFPTPEQARLLTAQFGAVRFVWNHMLALRLRGALPDRKPRQKFPKEY